MNVQWVIVTYQVERKDTLDMLGGEFGAALRCVSLGSSSRPRKEEFVMAQIQGPAYTGQTSCDLANVKDVLVDLAPGALVGARAAQEGIVAVLVELAKVILVHGEAAEIRVVVHDRVAQV